MIRTASMMVYAVLLLLGVAAGRAWAQSDDSSASPRIALVIGNGAYAASPLPTAANDAGLVAQTLAAAGFDVTGARDLDGAALRQTVQDFLQKAASGGPRGIAMVYLAGHALQVDSENYFAPTDAHLDRSAARPIEGFRIADLMRGLAATNLGARVVIVDGAYADAVNGPLSAGLALVDPGQGSMLAFNAAPGTTAAIAQGPYGTYARILTQNMKQGGIPVEEVFDRVRVAVDTETRGSAIPWNASKLLQGFTFFDRADNAPALGSAQVPFTSLRTRPLRDFSAEQAYDLAIARDTLPSYQEYLTGFPNHPLARRVRRVLAVRREALFWRDASRIGSPAAFWTYLRHYPEGPHGVEAQRGLAHLAIGRSPPKDFRPLDFNVSPPGEDEIALFKRGVLSADPDLPLPPPPPLFLLPPARPDDLRPPPPSEGPGLLPIPLAVAIPFVRSIVAPGAIMAPRNITGGYRQPRPFMAGPPTGGILPRGEGAQPAAGVGRASPVPEATKVAPAPPRLPVPPTVAGPAAPRLPAAGAPMASPVQPRQPVVPRVLAPSETITTSRPERPARREELAKPTPGLIPLAPLAQPTPRKRDDATPRQQRPPPDGAAPQAPAGIGRAASPGGGRPLTLEPSAGSKRTGPLPPRISPMPSGEKASPRTGGQHRGRPECGHPGQRPCVQ